MALAMRAFLVLVSSAFPPEGAVAAPEARVRTLPCLRPGDFEFHAVAPLPRPQAATCALLVGAWAPRAASASWNRLTLAARTLVIERNPA